MSCLQASEEQKRGVAIDQEVVELAAILHDVDDWKYRSADDEGSRAQARFKHTRHHPRESRCFCVPIN